jgi:phosphopantothenoylcysteine synthetase/decarboxylase
MPHEIIIGVSGGIAAFKSAALVSSLVKNGHGV